MINIEFLLSENVFTLERPDILKLFILGRLKTAIPVLIVVSVFFLIVLLSLFHILLLSGVLHVFSTIDYLDKMLE